MRLRTKNTPRALAGVGSIDAAPRDPHLSRRQPAPSYVKDDALHPHRLRPFGCVRVRRAQPLRRAPPRRHEHGHVRAPRPALPAAGGCNLSQRGAGGRRSAARAPRSRRPPRASSAGPSPTPRSSSRRRTTSSSRRPKTTSAVGTGVPKSPRRRPWRRPAAAKRARRLPRRLLLPRRRPHAARRDHHVPFASAEGRVSPRTKRQTPHPPSTSAARAMAARGGAPALCDEKRAVV